MRKNLVKLDYLAFDASCTSRQDTYHKNLGERNYVGHDQCQNAIIINCGRTSRDLSIPFSDS